jgi:hypothetical protein
MDFLPIILGTDSNAYGIARSIHQNYQKFSVCIGVGILPATKHSNIIRFELIEDLKSEDRFVYALLSIRQKYNKEYGEFILFASSDEYASLIIEHQEELRKYFKIPFVQKEIFHELNSKQKFYKNCEKMSLSYPNTYIISKEKYLNFKCPLSFPVVLKPNDSIAYQNVQFDGKKKAYIIRDNQELEDILYKISESDYKEDLILQDFIPGSDDNMRVVNSYSDKNGNVRMMSLGKPILEDVVPALIGNYVAIQSIYDKRIYQMIQTYLESIKYTGFANFDIKYDARDNSYKVFEINFRLGRSSFFSTFAGTNLFAEAVEDLIYGKERKELVCSDKEFLWVSVFPTTVLKYVEREETKIKAKDLIRNRLYGDTLLYAKDLSLQRYLNIFIYHLKYHFFFRKWFRKKGK